MSVGRKVVGWILVVGAFGLWGAYVIGAFFAYQNNFDGWQRFLGLGSPVSGLGLPIWGRGEVFGFDVKSYIWWWLFGGGFVCALVAHGLLGCMPTLPDIADDGADIGDIADLF